MLTMDKLVQQARAWRSLTAGVHLGTEGCMLATESCMLVCSCPTRRPTPRCSLWMATCADEMRARPARQSAARAKAAVATGERESLGRPSTPPFSSIPIGGLGPSMSMSIGGLGQRCNTLERGEYGKLPWQCVAALGGARARLLRRPPQRHGRTGLASRAVRPAWEQGRVRIETGGFFPTGISPFLCASGRGKTSFPDEETISYVLLLFPHLLICHVSIFD